MWEPFIGMIYIGMAVEIYTHTHKMYNLNYLKLYLKNMFSVWPTIQRVAKTTNIY